MHGRRSWYAPKTQPGIPHYRGPSGLARRATPMTYQLGLPVVIVNQGPTRGDTYAAATLDAPLGQVLTALVAGLEDR